MLNFTTKRLKQLVLVIIILILLELFGVFTHLFEKDFTKDFHYPYDGDVAALVRQMRENIKPNIKPINSYKYRYLKDCNRKCVSRDPLRLVYLVKSSPDHFDRRIAIRSTWGYQKRFSDVLIRTVFLIGTIDSTESRILESLEEESARFEDIVQGDFRDSYFNNTVKTMMGFKWAVNFCGNAKFYMFVDDDFYVSTKNLLRYVRSPLQYPGLVLDVSNGLGNIMSRRKVLDIYDLELPDDVRLYSGYVFNSSPHRHITSKWKVSLEEYPYDMWPPYVTAGAYVLSREALFDMYYASFYTKHFRFDDIYVGLLAYKMNIEPFHSDYFHFYKQNYDKNGYQFTVASHGYDQPEELLKVWTEQRSLGNA